MGDQPSNELGMSNVGGVFVVLIAGSAFAFFVAILEFLWNVRKVAVEEKVIKKLILHLFYLTFFMKQLTVKP